MKDSITHGILRYKYTLHTNYLFFNFHIKKETYYGGTDEVYIFCMVS